MAAPRTSDVGSAGDATAWWRSRAALLAALVVAIAAANLLWLTLDLRPPHWDRARHLTNSLIFGDRFALSPDWALLYTYYPPFAYWVTDFFYALLGQRDIWVASLSQSAFLAVLAFSTFGIASRVGSRRAGVLAAIVVITTPLFVSGFKDYMLDGPLTAMTALSLYLLIRSESFSARWSSLLFGLVCGLAVLTKWSFVLAMGLPAVVASVETARIAIRERSWARIVNLLGAGAVALAVGAPWYLRNLAQLRQDTIRYDTVAAQIEGDPPVLSLASLLYYGWNLLNDQLFLVPFLFFIAGIVYVARHADARRRHLYPLLLCSGSYLLFTALENKDPRFTLPMLPAVAVIATSWLDRLTVSRRRVLTGVLAAHALVTFVAISFGIPFLPRDVLLPLPASPATVELPNFTPSGQIVQVRGLRIWAQLNHPLGPPSRERWYQEEIFEEPAGRSAAALWYQGPNEDVIWFNTWGLAYFSERYRVPWVASLDRASHAAIRTRPAGPATPPAGFTLVREYAQPDGGVLRLYERTPVR